MSHCVATLPLESFTINYMQSGHSYLPNDADFGVIERCKKQAKDVYIPEHWMELIRQARKHNPFKVIEMKSEDFVDLQRTSKQLVNRKKACDGSPVKWLQIQSICFTKQEPQIMMFKYVCDDDFEWTKVDLRRGGKMARCNTETVLLSPRGRKAIKKEKFEDLQSLKDYIPPIYHTFYDSLFVKGSKNDDPDILPDEELCVSEEESEEEDAVI